VILAVETGNRKMAIAVSASGGHLPTSQAGDDLSPYAPSTTRPQLAPLCVKGGWRSRLFEGAPVLAGVKQRALDVGCGSALGQGVGIGLKDGPHRGLGGL
jgi:hypothetical protein